MMLGMPSNAVRNALHESKGWHLRVVKMPAYVVRDACYIP